MLSESAAAVAIAEPDPISVREDPVAVAYDSRLNRLYVADGYSGAIARIDGERHHRIATIEDGGVIAQRIADVAIAPDGVLYVSRIGHGRAGAIFRITPDGNSAPLEHISPWLWRHGLVHDADEHALYATQYLSGARGAHDGAIISIDLRSGVPSMLHDGFAKPLGITKLGSTLVVADARQRAVWRIELVAGRAVHRLQLSGDVDRPHSVCACGSDAVLVTTYDDERQLGTVRKLWLEGRRSAIVARGAWEPRGVATDGERVHVATAGGRVLAFAL